MRRRECAGQDPRHRSTAHLLFVPIEAKEGQMYQMDAQFADEVIECVGMLTGDTCTASWRSYSGRAMYGAKCFAIVVDTSEFVVGVAMGRVAADWESRFEPFNAVEMVEAMAASARTDSMGRGTVVYWPDVEAPEAEAVKVG